MTMIEKMARRIWAVLPADDADGALSRQIARAALEAIREVDEGVFNAGWTAMSGEPDQGPGEPWLAMIDAILAETPTSGENK